MAARKSNQGWLGINDRERRYKVGLSPLSPRKVGVPGDSITITPIGFSGLFRISDKDAGRLARESDNGELPGHGREIVVRLPDGRNAWLSRETYHGTDGPKRGWVWAVMPRR